VRRQFAILRSDWKNFVILFGQPAIIAALVSWVSNDTSLLLFFAYISTLWFGSATGPRKSSARFPSTGASVS